MVTGPVRISLLGVVRATSGEVELRLGGAKPQVLLAALALAAPQPVTVERLIDELWPDGPPASARKTVQALVARLRSSLGGNVIASTEGGYRLVIPCDQIDVHRFRAALDRGHRAAHPADGSAQVRAALAEWSGPPLAELAVGAALDGQRRSLLEQHALAAELFVQHQIDLGDHEGAVAVLEALVADEPLREHRWALLMTALARSGRRGEALRAYQRARGVLVDAIGAEPGPELRAREREILAGGDHAEPERDRKGATSRATDPIADPAEARRHHNLPVPRTPLFGRDRAIREAAEAVRSNRLVTVTGIGGVGKTRLALAAAAHLAGEFADGARVTDLVPVTAPGRLPGAVAEAVGLRLAADLDPLDDTVEQLAGRRLLLVLDNCEHLTDAVVELVDRILDRSEAIHVLATSRQRFGLADEVVVAVAPLETAPEVGAPAVRLLRDRAARLGVGPLPDGCALAEICQRLDGLPLAIELAAAQLCYLSPDQLLQRLDQRFALLTGPDRRRPHHRQASLQAVLDDTWSSLTTDGRQLLEQLTAFPASFDLDAVEGVMGGGAAATLGQLVDRAVVSVATRVADGPPSYRLLDTVRLFARQRTGDDGTAVRERHLAWLAATIDAAPLADHYTSLRLAGWYDNHTDDLREAAAFAATTGRVELAAHLVAAGGLAAHLIPSARSADLIGRIDHLLCRMEPASGPLAARLHLATALAAMGARSPGRMRTSAQAAIVEAGQDAPCVQAMALVVDSWLHALRDPEAALAQLAQAAQLAGAAGSEALARSVDSYRATFLALSGRTSQAAAAATSLAFTPIEADYSVVNAASLLCSMSLFHDLGVANAGHRRVVQAFTDAGIERGWVAALDASIVEAANGRVGQSLAQLERAVDMARQQGADDGLPDLLLAPAVAAYQLGDLLRAASMVRAVREAGRPTQNFELTLVYRQLRGRLSTQDPPPTSRDLRDVLDDARRWMSGLGATS